MPVVVLQSAKDDLRDGYLFYERQGGSYLGNYFLATLQADLYSLTDLGKSLVPIVKAMDKWGAV